MVAIDGRSYQGPEEQPRGSAFGTLLSWGGAIASLALVLGMGVWGYQMISRDVSGIPVVRAAEGPMRLRPETPGGELPVHQGLAVNTIAATGAAAPPPSRIVLAPRPVSLAAEDLPRRDLNLLIASTETPTAILDVASRAPVPLVVVPEADAEDDAEELAAIPLPSVGPMTNSPRPVPRPARDLVSAAMAANIAKAVTSGEVDPDAIATGTNLVQLGAFESAEVARSEWVRLGKRFEDFMVEKSPVVQRAESGGKAFYRLRAVGFSDRADAKRFCAIMQDGGANCIPVVVQ